MAELLTFALPPAAIAPATAEPPGRPRLRQHERPSWYRAAQRTAGLGVIHVERRPPGRILWSPEVYELFGLERHRAPLGSGELLERFITPRDRERVRPLLDPPVNLQGTLQVDFAVHRTDGGTRHVRGRCSTVLDAEHAPLQVCTTLQDVTDLVCGEHERHRAHERLAAVARQTTVGEIASGLAHEISQPLAAISTFAMAAVRLHAADPDDPELETALRQISAQAHRAGDALKRLIALARPNRSRRQVIDLAHQLREIGRLVEAPSRSEGIDVRLELPRTPINVDADPLQIQQLMLSLYRNAVEALLAPDRPVREIRIGAAIAGESVEVSVDDSGPGVEKGIEPMLFMPFFTTKPGGTGLGLVTARTIAHLHGGDLICRAPPGGGGGFVLTLPLAQHPTAPAGQES